MSATTATVTAAGFDENRFRQPEEGASHCPFFFVWVVGSVDSIDCDVDEAADLSARGDRMSRRLSPTSNAGPGTRAGA
jgi:hypothetical protein